VLGVLSASRVVSGDEPTSRRRSRLRAPGPTNGRELQRDENNQSCRARATTLPSSQRSPTRLCQSTPPGRCSETVRNSLSVWCQRLASRADVLPRRRKLVTLPAVAPRFSIAIDARSSASRPSAEGKVTMLSSSCARERGNVHHVKPTRFPDVRRLMVRWRYVASCIHLAGCSQSVSTIGRPALAGVTAGET